MPRALPQPATLRLQGLATLLASYSLRARAGFFSRRRRSWDSPFGAFSSRKVASAFPRRSDPRTVCPVGDPGPTYRAGPAQRAAVSGLRPFRESLAYGAVLVTRRLAAPLGFALLGFSRRDLAWDFTQAPPTRFPASSLATTDQRRPGVSISLGLAVSARPGQAGTPHGYSNPYRVLAPVRS